MEVKELKQQITVFLRIKLKWTDDRLAFKNLNEKEEMNLVGNSQWSEIWIPTLTFSNSVDDSNTIKEGETFLVVQRLGNGSPNALEILHEDLVYSGSENPLILSKMYTLKLSCQFHLDMFPFDMQKCPITLGIPFNLRPHMKLVLDTVVKLDSGFNLSHYDFLGFDYIPEYKTMGGSTIEVYLKLRRIFTYHLGTTFLPTLCLIFIAELTPFIDEKHFEATIMVALTSMLVMYTLYQSVSNSLPATAYLKMVDVWLLFGLIVPFFTILILIGVDACPGSPASVGVQPKSFFVNTTSSIKELKNKTKAKSYWSRNILTMCKFFLPIGTLIFFIIFWTVALIHYNNNF